MLLLILEAGGMRYGVAASRVVEVIPVPVLRPLPGISAFIPGVFSYHGRVVPVVDLSMLLSDGLSRRLLSTRILLVRFQGLQGNEAVLVGFMAEHATETLECNREEFQPAGVHGSGTPYAGDILVRPEGLIQELDLDRVLTAELHEQLFAEPSVPM
jgi:chemotaxis-related protein WspB